MIRTAFLTIFTIVALTPSISLGITDSQVLSDLEVGPYWNRSVVTAQANLSPNLKKVALSTANFRHGSAFYIGKFNGEYVMATNAHVVADDPKQLVDGLKRFADDPSVICRPKQNANPQNYDVVFRIQEKAFSCDHLIGVWPEIEFAIFSISVTAQDAAFFENLGVTFQESLPISKGLQLATFGYGEFLNPGLGEISELYTSGQFCRVFSDMHDIRLLKDPDEYNPAPYSVWSFATGCNIAWGDSGSPVVNAATGQVVGLNWTSRYPKDPRIKDPAYVQSMLDKSAEAIWTQLTYAAPANKIFEVLKRALTDKSISAESRAIIQALITSSP